MAIVTPLLLLLVMGIVDFGFMFQRYVVLTNAAVEGARVGDAAGLQRGRCPGPGAGLRHQRRRAGDRDVRNCPVVALPGAGGGAPGPACRCTVHHVYTLQYVAPDYHARRRLDRPRTSR